MAQSETNFKLRVLKDLKTLSHCWTLKTMERGRVGTPDLLICLKGKFVAIELKAEGKHTTKLQQLTLSRIAAAQGVSFESMPSLWDAQFELLKGMK